MFRRILTSALGAGLVAGLALTVVQQLEVVPIIVQAESYEGAGHDRGGTAEAAARRDQAAGATRHDDGLASEGAEAWAPAGGLERMLWTAAANVCIAVGFGLLLCAAYTWRGGVGLREGVLWGLGGFATFFVNPAFGLHPEIPGAMAADLELRQAWWIGTVVCTAAGLGLIALRRDWTSALAGVLLCLAPHLAGAPHPETAGGSAPLALAHAFVGATFVANAVFWVLLGLGTAWLFERREPHAS